MFVGKRCGVVLFLAVMASETIGVNRYILRKTVCLSLSLLACPSASVLFGATKCRAVCLQGGGGGGEVLQCKEKRAKIVRKSVGRLGRARESAHSSLLMLCTVVHADHDSQ